MFAKLWDRLKVGPCIDDAQPQATCGSLLDGFKYKELDTHTHNNIVYVKTVIHS